MLLDLTGLKDETGYIRVETSVNPKDITFLGRKIKMPLDFQLSLDIFGEKKEIVFAGEVKGEFLLECSRCLKEFNKDVNAELEFTIEREEIEDYSSVDVGEQVKENLILAIPIKALCRKDCQGICSSCGQDLNKGSCECVQDSVDPRLEKLEQFYNSGNE